MLVGKALGPFLIESELGTGAMGTVYRATRQDTGKVVAIKVIALGLLGNEKAVERFEREGDILKQLKHPNIVRLIANGRWDALSPDQKRKFAPICPDFVAELMSPSDTRAATRDKVQEFLAQGTFKGWE